MSSTSMIREAAALRHAFQLNGRLQLEFLADLSKLLREHKVTTDDNLISNLILAVPDELMNGMYAATKKSGKKKTTKVSPPQTPGSGDVAPPQTPSKRRVTPPQPGRRRKVSPPQAVAPPQTPSKKSKKR